MLVSYKPLANSQLAILGGLVSGIPVRARRPETIDKHARSPENELCCVPAGEETLRAQKPPGLKRRRNAIDDD